MSAEMDHRPIVVGIDGSVGSRAALGWAIDEATRRKVPLELVHSWRPMYHTARDPAGDAEAELVAREHGHALLTAAAATVTRSTPHPTVTTRLLRGRPSAALLDAATDAQLLVVGARGVGGIRRLVTGFGFLARRHLFGVFSRHSAKCPRGRSGDRGDRRIGRIGSGSACRVGRGHPARHFIGRHVCALCSFTGRGRSRSRGAFAAAKAHANWSLEQLLRDVSTENDAIEITQTLPVGYPAEVLAKASLNAQLLVVGSHGGGGFSGMKLGSTAHAVAHNAHCTVMVVRDRSSAH